MIRVISFGNLKNEDRDYYIRLTKKLIPFYWQEISLKRMTDQRPKKFLPEEEKFLKLETNFFILDAEGKTFDSEGFYRWLFQSASSTRLLVMGPPFGFHNDFKKRAEGAISLSPMTFTHTLAQTMLAEAIYRSACLLKNHPFAK